MIRFIEVREEDITMGDQGCADSCAIALALRNEYGQDVGCEVRLEDNLESDGAELFQPNKNNDNTE